MVAEVRHTGSGFGFSVDPKDPDQAILIRNLLLISTSLLAVGITLCSLHGKKILNIPCSVRNWVLSPMNGICSSLATMTFIAYLISLMTPKVVAREKRHTSDI